MSCHRAKLAAVIAFAAAVTLVRGQEQATFRSGVEVVSVSVSVLAGGKPIPSLTVADFALTDRGVAQTIDEVMAVSTPIDVSLVVDCSGSTANSLQRYATDIRDIAAMLRPDDRLRVVTFGTGITELLPLQGPAAVLKLAPFQTAGMTSLNDAIVGVLVRSVPLGRRHLAVVFSDGIDTMSVTTEQGVRELAGYSETVLHLVLTAGAGLPTSEVPVGLPSGLRQSANGVATLLEAAELTGGRRGWPGAFSGSLTRPFREAFDDFRSSYVLRYRPNGVAAAGWHELNVRVTRPGSHIVRARRGYYSPSAGVSRTGG